MTRVNCGINPKELNTRHLLAEHHEMVRIPNNVRKGKVNLSIKQDTFKLGTNHVRFFYTRLGYLLKRYKEVYKECIRRGFKVQNYESAWVGVPRELMGDYEEREEDAVIIRERIREKLHGNNQPI